jgi:hypothetical protein
MKNGKKKINFHLISCVIQKKVLHLQPEKYNKKT